MSVDQVLQLSLYLRVWKIENNVSLRNRVLRSEEGVWQEGREEGTTSSKFQKNAPCQTGWMCIMQQLHAILYAQSYITYAIPILSAPHNSSLFP